jgi:hypothetical protein
MFPSLKIQYKLDFFNLKKLGGCAFGTNWEAFDEYKYNEVLS